MRKVLFFLLILSPFLTFGQILSDTTESENLVFNPSFEEYLFPPRKIDALGILTTVEAWYQPTKGSADYFNRTGSRECGVPNNKLGIQLPYDGDGYCGIYCSQNLYREYLQTQLKHPLVAGRTYRLKFHVSLSERSPAMVATLGGLFTPDRIHDTTATILMKKQSKSLAPNISQTLATYYQPQVVNPYDRLLSDTQEWMLIEGEFTAQGGEKFLTIGNFFPTGESHFVDLDQPESILPGAYYYIDQVSVTCLDCQNLPPDTTTVSQTETTPQTGDVIVLHDIYFNTDESTLLPQSYNELQKLLELLNQNPGIKIEIGGHTDNQGSISHNEKLSERRALAVRQYLEQKHIDPKRLTHKGYGESQPLAPNTNDVNRALNRRVTITILKH